MRTETRTVVGTFSLNAEDDTSLEYEKSIVDCWKRLPTDFSTRAFVHDGCEVHVTLDWSPVTAHLAEQLGISTVLRVSPESLPENWAESYWAEIRLPAIVEIKGSNELSEYKWYPEFFVETYLYDVFVVLNLALPGAADFVSVGVESVRGGPRDRLELSAYYFENAFREPEQWPYLRPLAPATVLSWYGRVRNGFTQVPITPVERALFAMLHVCRSSGRPEDLVWLFYAFESLFQTRVGENYSALLDRLRLLLEPDGEREKELRKHLRAMYDYRSSFVHGGLAVIHPMHHEVMDKRVDETYGTTIKLSQYGTRLLLACFQRYIRENWREVGYKTTLEPANDEA